MLIAVCDCVQCAVCGLRLSSIRMYAVMCGSVLQCARLCPAVQQCAAIICAAVCSCLAVCDSVRLSGIFSNKFKTNLYEFV
jgi:hypothetical protein